MDKDKPILTQEMFDEKIRDSYWRVDSIKFEGYIVENIRYHYNLYCVHITFSDCIINELDLFGERAKFINCEIVDYGMIFNIRGHAFINCTFTKPIPLMCPEEGEFIAFKKCAHNKPLHSNKCIVKLLIPKDAKRSSAFTNKCRCSKAKVLAIYDLAGNELKDVQWAYSFYLGLQPGDSFLFVEHRTIYKIGEMVYSDDFDENRFNECSHGIHFFMSFDEARDYNASICTWNARRILSDYRMVFGDERNNETDS